MTSGDNRDSVRLGLPLPSCCPPTAFHAAARPFACERRRQTPPSYTRNRPHAVGIRHCPRATGLRHLAVRHIVARQTMTANQLSQDIAHGLFDCCNPNPLSKI